MIGKLTSVKDAVSGGFRRSVLLLALSAVFVGLGDADAGLKIYYIRHAEGGHNVKKAWEAKGVPQSEWPSYVGNPDVFTPKGEQEVIAATEKLQAYHFDFIASSPIWRARNTILPYLELTGNRAEVWPELREGPGMLTILSKEIPDLDDEILNQGTLILLPEEEQPFFMLRKDATNNYSNAPRGSDDNLKVAYMKHASLNAIGIIIKRYGGTDKSILLAGHNSSGVSLLKLLLQGEPESKRGLNSSGIWMVEELPNGEFKLMMYNDEPVENGRPSAASKQTLMDANGDGIVTVEAMNKSSLKRAPTRETVSIFSPSEIPAIQFAVNDLSQAFKQTGRESKKTGLSAITNKAENIRVVLGLQHDETLLAQLQAATAKSLGTLTTEGYAIRVTHNNDLMTIWAIGADATGAMYAGLSLAETITQDGIDAIQEIDCQPFIKKRGLKMNIPLDARTPSYADCGDAAQQNIAVVWDMNFWKEHLDALARDRYNTITLWSPHLFPSMVKVPEYPDVALDDVKIADIDWPTWFAKYAGGAGEHSVNEEVLDHLKIIKKISIEEKIEFWREVMEYAQDRGIEFHIITWNIFVWGADGKYGITDSINNETTIDYMRKSVRSLFETYPLLAGIGVTAGENMKRITPDQKENWLWKTYGLGVMDAKKAMPDRKIRFIHRYWMSKIPEITKHFDGFDKAVEFNFSFKYAKARLYSNTTPTFVDDILRDAPTGTKWWWNLRNDDIFYFRWGDADYVRAFINNLPPAEQTEGFHMGSDGYIWGREFVSTEPDSPRQLEIEKHWYKYMLWGRLGYDPTLSNIFFEKAIQQRFPGKPTQKLQAVWARSSMIIPAVNRFHWHDWDFQWSVEACSSSKGYHAITDKCWKAGGSMVADEIQGHAEFVLKELPTLQKIEGDKTWQRTLGDIEAMAHLGNYYAEKIRAADHKANNPEQAIHHLKEALKHWEKYAAIGQKQYKSQLLSRAGQVDWQQGYENAKKDISLMEGKK